LLVQCTMNVLSPENTYAGIALHNSISHGLSKDIFMPASENDIRRLFAGKGLAIGVHFGDRLVCLRTLVTDREWVNEALSAYGCKDSSDSKAAITGFCIVDKEFRGNNIQFLSYYYMENLVSGKFNSIITTVSPKNIFSLQNVMACGYHITGITNINGCFLRFILEKEFSPACRIWTNGHITVPVRDMDGHNAAIAAGNAGYKIICKKTGGFHILYGKAEQYSDE